MRRAMFDATQTLPNHTSMMTGLPVLGADGHQVTFNEDNGSTVHATAGRYVAGLFGVAHDAGLATALYAGKPKFDFLDRSWDASNGAPRHHRRRQWDRQDRHLSARLVGRPRLLRSWRQWDPPRLIFPSSTTPNPIPQVMTAAGTSTGYNDAVRIVDGYVGQILSAIETDSDLDEVTYVILTSDHGGTGTSHGDPTVLENATIPFFVWGPGVPAGAGLDDLNTATGVDPGATIPDHGAAGQRIRNADAANLALSLI